MNRDRVFHVRVNELELRRLRGHARVVDRPVGYIVRAALRDLLTSEPPEADVGERYPEPSQAPESEP